MAGDPNVVYVGRKPPMSYVTAIITSFTRFDSSQVTLKARGRAITTAVDVAEITRRRFMKELNLGEIVIGTEEIPREEGGTKNVSTIQITLKRGPGGKKDVPEIEKPEAAIPLPPVELTSIEGIGVKRAEKMKAQGVHSVKDLATFNPQELSEKLQVSEKRVSKWIEDAKKALQQ